MKRFSVSQIAWLSLVVLVSTATGPGRAVAQPPEPDGEPPAAASETQAESGIDLLIRDPAGQTQLLRRNIDRAQLLELLSSELDRQSVESAPSHDVVSIEIDGTADDKSARLTAKLTIQVHADDGEWVSVRAGFEEATLDRFDYQGQGQISLDRRNEKERRWWIRGQGTHQLQLKLIAPVRLTSPVRRLQLSLPTTASSRMLLRVPLERLSVTPPEGSWVETSAIEHGESQIKLIGLGTRLNLQWKPQASLNETTVFLQSECRTVLEMTTDPATLTVNQTVKALQGSFESFEAILPDGFELKKIEEAIGTSGPAYQDFQVVDSAQRRVRIRMREPVDAVNLRWTMERRFERPTGQLDIKPLRVEGVAIDTGEFEVIALQGFRFQELLREDIRRVTQPVKPGFVSATYRYANPNFSLQLNIVEVQPLFFVEPVLLLRVLEDSLQLDALYRFQVRQGAIDKIELDWPQWNTEGWEIQPVDLLTGVAITQLDLGQGGQPIELTLQDRQTGSFEVRLRAIRSPLNRDDPIELHLPRIRTSGRQSTNLIVANAENVDSTLESLGETVLLPLSNDRVDRLASFFPEYLRTSQQTGSRIDSVDHHLSCQIDVQPQSVTTSSMVVLDIAKKTVTQSIDYSVEFEALDEIRLLINDRLVPRIGEAAIVSVTLDDGTPLAASGSGLPVGNQQRVRYPLPEPKLGGFRVFVSYQVEVPQQEENQTQLRLPIIQSGDGAANGTRFVIRNTGNRVIRIDDPDWVRTNDPSPDSEWTTSASETEVVLEIDDEGTSGNNSYAVSRVLVRSWMDVAGYSRSRAQYRIRGETREFLIRLPEWIAIEKLWWNERPLIPFASVANSNPMSVRIPADVESSDGGLLTIDFHSTAPARFDWSERHRIEWPQLGDSTWIDQTRWELTLPPDQHLLTQPDGFLPEFEWRRAGLLWHRLPRARSNDLGSWIGSADGPPDPEYSQSPNRYQFARFGPPTSLGFRSIEWWAMILCGAGLTWIVGVILLKAPFTRHVLTIPLLATAVTAVGLRYPESIRVFLQPAALGFVLALIMVWIDTLARSRSAPAIPLAAAPTAAYGSSVGPVESDYRPISEIESEGSTAVRPPSYSGSSKLESSA